MKKHPGKKTKIRILMAAAECAPFAKVGGLGDVLGSLPPALASHGLAVSVIMPKYGSISERTFRLKKIFEGIQFEYNGELQLCSLYHTRLPGSTVDYYFLDHPFFKAQAIYVGSHRVKKNNGRAYTRSIADVERFSFFSHAVVETIHQMSLPVDILHCHDWHTALIPSFVDQLAVTKSYQFTKTVLTIHNLANQGFVPREDVLKFGFTLDTTPSIMEDYFDLDRRQLNLMKLGILSADHVTTVSPTYAKEVLTSEYGAGLETFLQRRAKDLSGIINGIDTKYFNPATDRNINVRYTRSQWKTANPQNKKDLQKTVGLPPVSVPHYGLVSRLVTQKGFDILEKALPDFLQNDVQVVILGTGEKTIEHGLRKLALHHPHKLKVHIGFDLGLAQKIYAGSDFFLMPSRFEPCGLGQLIAMRYGTIPIVRATGGLKDTVHHMKTGLVFAPYTAEALLDTLNKSIALYRNTKAWYTMADRCMREDFSWKKSALAYVKLYRQLA